LRLAIIIPTLNEAPGLPALLAHVRPLADELWVSDGGSQDGTLELATALGAQVVSGAASRGGQLNRGARASSAEILLFLHADTKLPVGASDQVQAAIAGGAVGGAFQVAFDGSQKILRLGERLVNLRTRLTGCPLGDQAQFVHRQAFTALGGFRDWPILEDLDFARRLKRLGRTVLITTPVTTSARRFLNQGILRTIATNWLIWALYFSGVPPRLLTRLYGHIR
jgi:rSAM/selenodomain-associated transferase 2